MKSQWRSRDEIREYQNRKLTKLIQHIYHNIPYYHTIMKNKGIAPHDIRSVDDLKHLPILTKELIKKNAREIVFKGMNKRGLKKVMTGGTTGERLSLFRDRTSRIWEHAALLRGWSWARYNIGDTMVEFTIYNNKSMLGSIQSKLLNSYSFFALAKAEEILNNLEKVKSLKPDCITGLASSLYNIATLMGKYHINSVRVPILFSYGEMLHDYQRKVLADTFNGKVYDYYGSNEIGSIAYDCEYNKKHITDEHVIFETISSNGINVNKTPGDIVLTDLDNYAMPFIRYKIGDVGTLLDNQCECGRGLRMLASLDGRSQEFLKTMDGHYVPGVYFPPRFRQLKGIEQFQIIQPDINNINLKIVKNDLFSANEVNTMILMIKEKLGEEVNVSVEECASIPMTSRGKTRLVISHLPTEF